MSELLSELPVFFLKKSSSQSDLLKNQVHPRVITEVEKLKILQCLVTERSFYRAANKNRLEMLYKVY